MVGIKYNTGMDEVGAKTLEIMSAAPWYNAWVLRKLKPYVSGSILEAGAGIGNMTKYFSKLGPVTAIDYDRGYVDELKKKGYPAGFGDIEKGKFFFGRQKFDTIVSTNVLEHIKEDQKAIGNLSKLLSSGGRLVILVPAHEWAYGEMDKGLGHFRRYNKKSLVKLFEASGLTVIEAKYLNWFAVFGWALAGRILKRKLIPSGQLRLFSGIAPLLLKLEDYISFPFGLSVLVVGEKK